MSQSNECFTKDVATDDTRKINPRMKIKAKPDISKNIKPPSSYQGCSSVMPSLSNIISAEISKQRSIDTQESERKLANKSLFFSEIAEKSLKSISRDTILEENQADIEIPPTIRIEETVIQMPPQIIINLPPPTSNSPPPLNEANDLDLIIIENDPEELTSLKHQRFEELKSRKLEEFEKRKSRPHLTAGSTDRLEVNIIKASPLPSPKMSPRPSLKLEARISPRPTHKSREEIKSTSDKYKRHKNLPNLVFNKPSNKKIIKNAISQACLAGEHNKTLREEILSVIEGVDDVSYFIIVFSDTIRRDIRGVYSHDPASNEILKIYGPSYLPQSLDAAGVSIFFRYDSGAKEFKVLQCKDFISATDAVCLKKIHKAYENN